ncbi:RNA-binding protein [bacterium]|jgi:RNA recognition motif-containing protein|nr:RNA-binding protein [bacterium]
MNLYVGNLAYGLTEDGLKEAFEEFGTVTKVTIIRDRETGNSKGFGFVEMDDQAAGEQAIQALDGKDVQGRNIKVNQARPREERPAFGR